MPVDRQAPPSWRVLVTGVGGLIGGAVAAGLRDQGHAVVGAVRRAVPSHKRIKGIDYREIGDIGPATHWSEVLKGFDAVVHSAAHAHVMTPTAADRLAYQRVNVEGTRALAAAARRTDVRRFLLVSSIKVNGESTPVQAFTSDDVPAPRDAFGLSKLGAERALRDELPDDRWVIVRPPIVYGAGMRGNFARMAALVSDGWPLPFASIRNRRSFVGVDNLADLLALALVHPAAAGKVWLVSDDQDLSTPQLVRAIAAARGCDVRLWRCPASWLRAAGFAVGRSDELRRLTESLYVNIDRTRRELGWAPRLSVEEGMRRALVDARIGR